MQYGLSGIGGDDTSNEVPSAVDTTSCHCPGLQRSGHAIIDNAIDNYNLNNIDADNVLSRKDEFIPSLPSSVSLVGR